MNHYYFGEEEIVPQRAYMVFPGRTVVVVAVSLSTTQDFWVVEIL